MADNLINQLTQARNRFVIGKFSSGPPDLRDERGIKGVRVKIQWYYHMLLEMIIRIIIIKVLS